MEKNNLNAKLHSLNWLWSDLILNIASGATIINMIEFVRFIFWSHLFKFTFQWIETLLWYCGTLNRYIDIIQEFEFCFITKYCYRKLSLYSNQLNNKWRISLSFAHIYTNRTEQKWISFSWYKTQTSSFTTQDRMGLYVDRRGAECRLRAHTQHTGWQPFHFPLNMSPD